MSGTALDSCGCFPELSVRAEPWNRPGLPRIDYRAATWAGVLERLLARLDQPWDADDAKALAALRTREADDPVLGLIDAFAIVADVLGFYQERIANEGFLGTAGERRSVHELARLIGYEPAPGVSARAWLQFNVDDRVPAPPGSALPPSATVPAATRVQSVPGQDELPQTFETSAELVAHAERNELRPRLGVIPELDASDSRVYLEGMATGLGPGDVVVIADHSGTVQAKPVRRLVVDHERRRTRVDFVSAPGDVVGALSFISVIGTVTATPVAFQQGNADSVLGQSWTEGALSSFLTVHDWSPAAFLAYAGTTPPPPELGPAEPGIYALRDRLNVFGHNAPKRTKALDDAGWDEDWDETPRNKITINDSQAATATHYEDASGVKNATDLEPASSRILADSWVALEDANGDLTPYRVATVAQRSRADYAISGKIAHVEVTAPGGGSPSGLDGFTIRDTTVHAESERLEQAEALLPETIDAADGELVLDGLVLGLEAGQSIALAGEDAELDGVRWNEVITLIEATHRAGHTTLHFGGLEHSYKRSTVTLNANVVEATHGEAVGEEILGSGSGGPDQRFALAKPPLTHTQSASGDGAESSLEVWIDGVRWERTRGLYGLEPRDEHYVARRNDDGRTEVIFGDGERGASPPSGTDNVRARYRSGIGAGGNVPAGSLTLLQTRPLGVRDVVNPLAASGGTDPEGRDSARAGAPLTVMTMGRVVTLADYEHFATSFIGIAKARASELWRAERRVVHLTVAAEGGEAPDGERLDELRDSLRAAGDLGVALELEPLQLIPVEIGGSVLVDPAHEFETVRAGIAAALGDRYGFERRGFGESIAGSQVVAAALEVPGALDFSLTALHPVFGPPPEEPVVDPLHARPVRFSDGPESTVAAAELLVLSPVGATITEATA
jgi:predicted phage baseplate assembly protein